MPIVGTPAQRKKQVFDEFKAGDLHSGPRRSCGEEPEAGRRDRTERGEAQTQE